MQQARFSLSLARQCRRRPVRCGLYNNEGDSARRKISLPFHRISGSLKIRVNLSKKKRVGPQPISHPIKLPNDRREMGQLKGKLETA